MTDSFQAAWDGDLDTIKSLTLAPWGPNGENTPLKIAVMDGNSQSPYSLAVLRGHLDVARATVEICFAQYHPDNEKPKARYRMGEADEEYSDDEEAEHDVDADIPVYQEIVDDKFTIENIGEVSKEVKSKVSPSGFINWSCSAWDYKKHAMPDKKYTYGVDDCEINGSGSEDLLTWAIKTNDNRLFQFVKDLDVEWTHRLADKSEDPTAGVPSFSLSDFNLAIKYGRLDMLAEMINTGGAGMELESLVQKSGVKYQEKPKFYQGLSVRSSSRLPAIWRLVTNSPSRYMAKRGRIGLPPHEELVKAASLILTHPYYKLRSKVVLQALNGS